MFYLTTHSIHFIYGYTASVKGHSDSEGRNPIKSKTFLHSHRHDSRYNGCWCASYGAMARKLNGSTMRDRTDDLFLITP